jgi:hypothetical protein
MFVTSAPELSLNPTMAKGQHGGARPGAGRKSVFGAKALAKPFSMDFTPAGRKALDALVRRTTLSRNAVIATLALQFADRLTFDLAAPFPGKLATAVLSIRVPPDAGAKLAAAHVRTGKSYSDIGEALVRWHGASARYPSLTTRKRPRSRQAPRTTRRRP